MMISVQRSDGSALHLELPFCAGGNMLEWLGAQFERRHKTSPVLLDPQPYMVRHGDEHSLHLNCFKPARCDKFGAAVLHGDPDTFAYTSEAVANKATFFCRSIW